MPIESYAPVVVGLVGLLGFIWAYNTTFAKKQNKTMPLVVTAMLLVYGLVGVLGQTGYINLGDNSGYFLTSAGVVIPSNNGVTTTTTAPVTGEKSRVIDTLKAISKTEFSNSYTTVSGSLKFFDPAIDPSEPNANAVDSVTLSSGVGSSTNGYLRTNTPYRVTFDGGGTYYDADYGIVQISDDNFNPSTGTAQFDLGEITTVATIDDMLDESDASTGDVNGQTTTNASGTAELGYTSADSFMYDESVGDGQWYIKPTMSASTANTALKNPVLCFEWDTSTPPEGTEVTAISVQLVEGTDFGIPSDLLSYWTNEQCVQLTSEMKAGQSSKIKMTVTYDESALDADDLWYLGFDDLGELRGKDVNLDTGATLDRITFDGQA